MLFFELGWVVSVLSIDGDCVLYYTCYLFFSFHFRIWSVLVCMSAGSQERVFHHSGALKALRAITLRSLVHLHNHPRMEEVVARASLGRGGGDLVLMWSGPSPLPSCFPPGVLDGLCSPHTRDPTLPRSE